jgi:adenosylhomocysteine nucleosidase
MQAAPIREARSADMIAAAMSIDFPDPLVVMALPLESQGVFERAGIPVLYTGIGKVNAAYALTRRLGEYLHAAIPLPHVINFGTAGSRRHPTGAMVECHMFVQRDMDVSGLGVPLGVTPFEETPAKLHFPPIFEQLPRGVCGSGDSFAITEAAVPCDVVDMEGYALAFTSVKFITDGADHAAAQDWQSNLKHAADGFLKLYRELFENDG